jgi:hypothetical protein
MNHTEASWFIATLFIIIIIIIIIINLNCKWGFTRCQWHYNKTQHKNTHNTKTTHHAQTKHSTQSYTNNLVVVLA